MTDPVKVIARGGQPSWEETYEHPEHGEMTFKGKLPTARQLMEQSIAMDNLLAELSGDNQARSGTVMLASSITGMLHVLELPVVREERVVEDPDSGHEVIHQIRYDPMEEPDTEFLVNVWADFWLWRQNQLERIGELKNSSGETSGNGSSEPSNATTDSPSTIPA
jgi:hypothetical protein